MLMDVNAIAETRAIEYLWDGARDSFVAATPAHEARSFDLPGSIWKTMFAAYAVFFAALIAATGRGASALFMIAISIGYAVMYFGTAAVINSVDSANRPEPTYRPIETATGPLAFRDAAAQILTVPLMLALFACAIAVIRGGVGG